MLKNLNIKIYKKIDYELEKLWTNFEEKSLKFCFQTYQWQKNWFKQIKKYKNESISMYVVVVKNNEEEILLILPFCIRKILFFKILSWSGFPFSDYNVPLINKNFNFEKGDFNEIWKLILKKNKQNYNCIFLENQPETINNQQNPFFENLKTLESNFYFGANLKSFSFNNNNQLPDINYQKNRLGKIGDLKFNFVKNKKEKKDVLRFIVKNKIIQYQKTNAWNLFKINAYKKFFILCNLKPNINLSYLTLDKNIIAAHSGYIYDQTFYYLFPTYDLKYKKYSPGKILLHNLIEHCVEKELSYFDFTIGSEDYKKNWSNNKIKSCMTLKSLNGLGFVYILFISIKIYLKSINTKNNFIKKTFNKIRSSVIKS